MNNPSTFARLFVLAIIAIFCTPMVIAQTHTPGTAPGKSGSKVSMRQMGMGKMKNSERWKAAVRRADRRAAAVRTHGRGGK